MEEQFALVINITTKCGHETSVKEALERAMPLIRDEVGCIQFELLYDPENETKYIIYEVWQSKETWHAHLSSNHMMQFSLSTSNAFTQFHVSEMKFVH